MRLFRAAALALIAASSSLHAQTIADLTTTPTSPGEWTYAQSADGSEAVFKDANATPLLWLRCTRVTREVSVARPATAAASTLNIWTSTTQQSLSATYNAATGRISFGKYAFDPLFDAMAFSRGRIGVSVGADAPVVVPPWEEVARVIEDCRV
jgi:hypothetical protein